MKFLYSLPGFSEDAKIDLYTSSSHNMNSKPIRLTAVEGLNVKNDPKCNNILS